VTDPIDRGETGGTHDASLRSWVTSANDRETDFPIQNLPFGMFRRRGTGQGGPGIAIGDRVLDLLACARAGFIPSELDDLGRLRDEAALNHLLAGGRDRARAWRRWLVEFLQDDNAVAKRHAADVTIAQSDIEMLMPVRVGDYSDFYASIHHATNVGSMFRPDNPLLPNYKYLPIGYHGRSSSIVVSGTPVKRPSGQTREDQTAPPSFGPTRRLDYEMEVGVFIGAGNPLGESIALRDAPKHLWGFCLVNDWSARDIQSWEYQPLGPFLAKNFATSISPWIVTLEALEPFATTPAPRPAGDPPPLPHLTDTQDAARGAFDVTLEVWIESARMREKGTGPMLVSRGNLKEMYWTMAQLVAHHASNGCNLRPGDLIASGTVSGSTKESRGCLLERTWRGSEPLELPTGERRAFLEDGDEIVMKGYAQRDGFRRIGFGECRGVVT
jgi:fumarylacetoacetase